MNKPGAFLRIALAVLACGWLSTAHAFPPAPHHTIKGTVRDQQGYPLTAQNATIIFETTTGVVLEAPIVFGQDDGINYTLEVPMDAGISPGAYKPTAVSPLVPFTISVKVGSTVFLPLEMVFDIPSLGEPGGISIINLTLGEDSDGDGLPDAWELALIQALGLGGLGDVNPGDDSDGDGMSNLAEYLAGTYAYDDADNLRLEISGFNSGNPLVKFLALRGRTYSIQASENLDSWSDIAFDLPAILSNGSPVYSYQSQDVRDMEVELKLPTPNPNVRFFRLIAE